MPVCPVLASGVHLDSILVRVFVFDCDIFNGMDRHEFHVSEDLIMLINVLLVSFS